MNKTEILAALAAAGVAADESMTVAQLKELAAANNVSLVKDKPPEVVATPPAPAEPVPAEPVPPPIFEIEEDDEPSDIEEIIKAKVAAGLTYEQAVEVIKRQMEADRAAAQR